MRVFQTRTEAVAAHLWRPVANRKRPISPTWWSCCSGCRDVSTSPTSSTTAAGRRAPTLTSPGCPAGPQIIKSVQDEAQKAFPELETVNVHLVWTSFWSPDMMSDEAKDELGIY